MQARGCFPGAEPTGDQMDASGRYAAKPFIQRCNTTADHGCLSSLITVINQWADRAILWAREMARPLTIKGVLNQSMERQFMCRSCFYRMLFCFFALVLTGAFPADAQGRPTSQRPEFWGFTGP